uniref:Nucleoplasmin core domain-containing protein n=1 Tax=Gopherus agassizii TaxID=38772 RepID=A0A452GWR8_9SAUR
QTYTFKIPDEWKYEQQLALRTICLGEKAKDEFNVVEIVPSEDSQDTTPVPLATLKPSVLPMATMVGVELTPPVTFRLRAGSGPVYITGQHPRLLCFAVVPDLSWDEEEEEEEEEVAEEEESQEDSPPKAIKHPASNKRGSIAKVLQELSSKEHPLPVACPNSSHGSATNSLVYLLVLNLSPGMEVTSERVE